MNKSEIIELLRQPAVDAFVSAAESKRILPSILIAGALIKLEGFSEDELELLVSANNYHALKAGKKYTKEVVTIGESKYKTFSSVEDFISGVSDYTGSVMSYSDALKKKNLPESVVNSYTSTITGYSLDSIDEEAIEKLYSGKSIVVETDSVKEEEEKKVEEEQVETVSETVEEPAVEESVINATTATVFDKGTMVRLINANLYKTPVTTIPTRSLTGTYYLVDGVSRNGRYGIVMKEAYVGDARYTLGYVKKEQLCR